MGVCVLGGGELSKQRANVRLGPVRCGHRAEGPDDGVGSSFWGQTGGEVREGGAQGPLVQQCEGVPFISYEREPV